MPAPLDVIRQAIIEEVFTPRTRARFVPEGGEWLMDFRRVCLDPAFLDAYTDAFYERYRGRYPFQVGGMEVAAIPLVAAIVMKMRERGMPVNGFFIRKSRKKSGLLKMIEGKLTDDPVILVDDLINHGYTLDRQLAVLAEAKRRVIAFATVLRFRPLDFYRQYTERGIAIEACFGLDEFADTLGTQPLAPDAPPVLENFAVKWYFRAPDARLESVHPKSGAVFDAERVYVGTDRGIMYALDRSDGKVVWQHQIGFGRFATRHDKEIFATPLLLGGRLTFGAYDGNVYCLDAKTGKRLWVSFEADWVHGSVAYSERAQTLFVPALLAEPGRPGGLVVLDPVSGKRRSVISLTARPGAAPLLLDELGMWVVADEAGRLTAGDLFTGRIRWSFQSGGAVKETPIYDARAGRIIFSSFDGSIYALSAEDGMLAWRFEVGLPNYSAPVLAGDRVCAASLDKHLYALDRETGKRLWLFRTRARIFTSPRVYQGRLYCGGNDARLYEIDPATGRQTGYFQAVERITNPLAYDPERDEYLLTTYANEVYCLKRKEA